MIFHPKRIFCRKNLSWSSSRLRVGSSERPARSRTSMEKNHVCIKPVVPFSTLSSARMSQASSWPSGIGTAERPVKPSRLVLFTSRAKPVESCEWTPGEMPGAGQRKNVERTGRTRPMSAPAAIVRRHFLRLTGVAENRIGCAVWGRDEGIGDQPQAGGRPAGGRRGGRKSAGAEDPIEGRE